jgi:hypothetical protein
MSLACADAMAAAFLETNAHRGRHYSLPELLRIDGDALAFSYSMPTDARIDATATVSRRVAGVTHVVLRHERVPCLSPARGGNEFRLLIGATHALFEPPTVAGPRCLKLMPKDGDAPALVFAFASLPVEDRGIMPF